MSRLRMRHVDLGTAYYFHANVTTMTQSTFECPHERSKVQL